MVIRDGRVGFIHVWKKKTKKNTSPQRKKIQGQDKFQSRMQVSLIIVRSATDLEKSNKMARWVIEFLFYTIDSTYRKIKKDVSRLQTTHVSI